VSSLKGCRVVCVGGASGMGHGIAEVAAEHGASVVVTSRSLDKAEAAANEIGPAAEARAVDLTSDESMRSLADSLDRIDHLVVTAGATGRSSFLDTPPAEARRFMDDKLWGTHALVWALRPNLARDASITLLSGGYAQWPAEDSAHVHVAFAATEAFARAVAVSLAPVRCNVVRPGFVDTALWDFMEDDERAALAASERRRTLIGRVVTARDIGDAAVALMLASVVTGVVVPVDGGRHLRPEA